jgi:Protein of unknown function (DUF3102)
MSTPTIVSGSGLVEDAQQLNAEYTAVVAGGIALKAIAFGEKLKLTKDKVGYGLWGSWVAANCKFTERHAHRFMDLAAKKDKLPLKDQTRMSELTLAEAFRLVADKAAKKAEDPGKASARAASAAKALLANLWKLSAREADHVAGETIKQIQDLMSKRTQAEPVQKIAA